MSAITALTACSFCFFVKTLIIILGKTTDESSYVIGSFKSDSLSASNDITASLNDIKQQLFFQRSNLIIEPGYQKSPTVKGVLINGSNTQTPNGNEKPVLMTRRELTDPFGSDEEDENTKSNGRSKTPPRELISPPAIDNVSIRIYKSFYS